MVHLLDHAHGLGLGMLYDLLDIVELNCLSTCAEQDPFDLLRGYVLEILFAEGHPERKGHDLRAAFIPTDTCRLLDLGYEAIGVSVARPWAGVEAPVLGGASELPGPAIRLSEASRPGIRVSQAGPVGLAESDEGPEEAYGHPLSLPAALSP